MDAVSNNPGYVLVVRGSGKGHLVLKLDAFLLIPAAIDICGLFVGELGLRATNSDGTIVTRSCVVLFDAINEIESGVRISDVVVGASLNLVVHALNCPVLA